MDYTMSIRGKFSKTKPKCLRAIYPKQKNLKPQKTIKPQPDQAHPPKGLPDIVIKNAFMFLKQKKTPSNWPLSKINSTPLTSRSERLKRSFPNVMRIR